MGTQILMPALSPTMTEGKLARWLKNEGDDVRAGDVIAEIETDKATMEVEAVDEGKLTRIIVPEGTEGVSVNSPIAELNGGGGEAAQPQAPGSDTNMPQHPAPPAAAQPGEVGQVAKQAEDYGAVAARGAERQEGAAKTGAAERIIRGKGATNYAIGLAATRVLEAILRDENSVLPVTSSLAGFDGLDDVCLSLPSLVSRRGVVEVLDVPMSAHELDLLHGSGRAVRAVAASLGL